MKPRKPRLPLTAKDAIPFSKLPKENQEWIIAWTNTYRRIGLTDEEFQTLNHLTMKMRWGFTAEDLEAMTPMERACLATYRKFWIAQANRFMGGRSKPDPQTASYFGGKQPTVPVGEHESIRLEVRRLMHELHISKQQALVRVRERRKLKASLKTLRRICEDR
jgi:hypothetical protein